MTPTFTLTHWTPSTHLYTPLLGLLMATLCGSVRETRLLSRVGHAAALFPPPPSSAWRSLLVLLVPLALFVDSAAAVVAPLEQRTRHELP
ncbi:hypothetical protein BC939DRAFT_467283 [Gamsiella multidivaricata]|uniref:uncharacterized protein n=1 Tax=Gamsiella multidivaricata TaxID=101098 RepID=UPI00221F5DD7|nr:uncharacterized protein BC939DRAFT_467283 [Gamsiella multidivaricata]KAI7816998.1 hypothetical protein BC939DRAFT_467283 [Gamsiella multidivaricata]